MNRLLKFACILSLLLAFACKKEEPVAATPPPPPPPPPAPIEKAPEPVEPDPEPVVEVIPDTDPLDEFFNGKNVLVDVTFDFDKADLREDTKDSLKRHSNTLRANPGLTILIEGHCDERGTEDYNMALGERRATRIRNYLIELGVDPEILKTISYGETQPKSMNSDEEGWAQNRRGHFKLSRKK